MSIVLTQREAVYRAVTSCKDETGRFDRKEAIEVLMNMYTAGEFEVKAASQKESDKALRAYMGSVISNWTKKDTRLSGCPVNTPERRNRRPADDEMKRLTMAKVVLMNEGASTEEIDVLIKQRQDELSATRSRRQEHLLELTK